MHHYLAALHPRLQGCSGFDLVKVARSLADLGYNPARPFLADFAAAVEVGCKQLVEVLSCLGVK
jgi:hypothetical protein